MVVVKILIIATAILFIGRRIRQSEIVQEQEYVDRLNSILTYSNISILLLLSIFNWTLEVLKWKVLISKITKLTFYRSLKQCLAAHVSSLVTPGKIGDFGTKALFYESSLRKKVLFLSFLGSVYQMIATTSFGLLGLGIVVYKFFPERLPLFFLGCSFFLLGLYFSPNILKRIRWSLKGFSWERIQNFTATLSGLSKRQTLGLSFLKYLVFAHQYFFLLFLFGPPIAYPTAMALILSMYFLSSLVPLLQLFDFFVRAGVAIVLFGLIDIDEIIILTITLIMWFLNIALPTIPGSYFLIRLRPPADTKKRHL